MRAKPYFAIFLLTLALVGCKKESDFQYQYYSAQQSERLNAVLNLPELPDDYRVSLPVHLTIAGLTPVPVEREKAILGRVLFYDKHLSKDQSVSCGSCHIQSLGFGDNHKTSLGVFDRVGERNAIPLSSVANFAAYYGTDINGAGAVPFFWDNRAETAAIQCTGSLTNPKEMDMTLAEVVARVSELDYYQPLFEKAYGIPQVTESKILEGLAAFINSMGSHSSKFDTESSLLYKDFGSNNFRYPDMYSAVFPGFTAEEQAGKDLYMQNCSSCHTHNMGRPFLFNSNNGLYASSDHDAGVGGITGMSTELGTFKVPTLRNIAITAPYMHDGSLPTLEAVIEHYSTGIKMHPNLAYELKSGNNPRKMNFTAQEKNALVQFLNTLTDEKFLVDPRFSDPFKP